MIKKAFLTLFVSLFLFNYSFGQTPKKSLTKGITWEQMMSNPNYSLQDVQKKFYEKWANLGYVKEDGYKLFKRWEYWMEAIVDKNGFFDYKKVASEYVRYKQDLDRNIYRSNEANWEQLGPFGFVSNYGIGRINVVGFDPNDVNTLWLGAPAGGLWKSTDAGKSWTPISDDYRMMGISDIEVDYGNSDIVYVATGDREAGDTYTYGVFKSTDGGKTWDDTNFPYAYRITELLINPEDGNQLYAATSSGIYKTVDGGINWTQILSDGNIKQMIFKPRDFNVLYATNTVSGDEKLTFFRSENGGDSFKKLKISSMSSDVTRAAIAVTESNPDLVFLSAAINKSGWDGQDFEGLYKSTDSGNSFNKVQMDTPPELGSQSWYDWTFTVSPDNPDELFAGGVRLYRSINGGRTWAQSVNWSNPNNNDHFHVDHHFIGFQPGTLNLFVGCDGGVYKSNNKGKYWEALNDNLSITQYYKMGVSTTVEHLIIAGSQDNGSHLLKDNDWKRVMGGDGMDCGIDPKNPNIIYASYQLGNIRKSINRGNNFHDMINGNITGEKGSWVTPLAINPQNPDILYAGFESVWKSVDKGENWDKVSGILEDGETIKVVEISPFNTSIIYASTRQNLFKSIDGGSSWTEIKNPNGDFIRDIKASPKKQELVYVVSRSNIYKSLDGGSTWEKINGTLPSVPLTSIAIQNNSLESIYLGTFIGVFYTDNAMTDWIPYNDGLPPVRIGELEINSQFGKLMAASFGRGMWETTLYDFNPNLPYCTTITSPENNSRIVSKSVLFKWDVAQKAEGYIINIGTEIGANDLIDSLDVGNVLQYTWGNIQYEGRVYVSVTPYNSFGQAHNCIDNSYLLGCAYDDKAALIKFYKSTGGDNWTVKWDTTDCDLSTWYGVMLDENGRVSGLDFDGVFDNQNSYSTIGNNLVGIIDSSIGDLEFLKNLYLAGNSLTGEIPNSISKLTGLKEVNLAANDFEGAFPLSLTKLKLKFLDISNNSFTGEIASNLKNWKNMEKFNASHNDFSGTIPSSLGALKSAWTINLSANNLTGKIPYQIYFMKNLYVFNVSDNKLSGKISKRFAKMQSLSFLYLNDNDFEGSIPKEFGDKTWNILYLQNNSLSGCFDENLKQLCSQSGVINFKGNSGLPNNGNLSLFCGEDIGNCAKFPGCVGGFALLTGEVADSLPYNSSIHWQIAEGAEKYIVSIGTESKGTDIANSVDVGNSNSYDAGELPIGKRIYVNITPYNKYGKTLDCEELSFVAVESSSVFEDDTIGLGTFLDIYPIPAKDFISINKKSNQLGDISFSILDIHGETVVNELIYKKEKDKKISLKSLPKGMYIIKMTIKHKEYYKKLIVQ